MIHTQKYSDHTSEVDLMMGKKVGWKMTKCVLEKVQQLIPLQTEQMSEAKFA